MKDEEIKKRIMRRVYLIYSVRKALSPAFVFMYVLAGLVLYGASSVSVANVFRNTPKAMDMSKLYNFYSYALMNTETIVKAAFVAGIVLVSIIAYGAAKKAIGRYNKTAPTLTFN